MGPRENKARRMNAQQFLVTFQSAAGNEEDDLMVKPGVAGNTSAGRTFEPYIHHRTNPGSIHYL